MGSSWLGGQQYTHITHGKDGQLDAPFGHIEDQIRMRLCIVQTVITIITI